MASDNFDRASLGATWTNQGLGGSTPAIVGSLNLYNNIVAFGACFYNAVTFANDQSSAITVDGSSTYVAAGVRHSGTTAGTTNFAAYFSHGSFQQFINGAQFVLTSGGGFAVCNPGNVLKLSVVADLYTPSKDGTPGTGTSNFTLTSGQPGVAFYSTAAGARDWTGEGDSVGGGAPTLPQLERGMRGLNRGLQSGVAA